MKHRPVAPGWRVSRTSIDMCTCTRVGHKFMQPKSTLAEFYVSLRVLMHWYTCIYLPNTLGSAVEQLAVHLSIAKQATVSS